MRTIGCGHDHGNSRTTGTVYISGQERMLTFPSASSDGSLSRLAKMRRGVGDETIVNDYQALGQDEYVLVYDGSERFVGSLAQKEGHAVSTGRGDMHRYWSRRSLETLLVAVGTMIPDTEFELLVVTGLPVKTFNEETKRKVKQALNGFHRFSLNGRERLAIVKVGKVLMEGAGASLVHGIDEHSSQIQGFIDIGGYSTDLYVRQGLEVVAKRCDGIDVGVEQVADKVSSWFEAKYGYSLDMAQREQFLHAYVNRGVYPEIWADGMAVPASQIETWVKKAIAEVGKDIQEFVSRSWRIGETGKVASNFSSIEVVGGGAYYFLDMLRQITPRAYMSEQPEHANARGYGWYADQLVQMRKQQVSA